MSLEDYIIQHPNYCIVGNSPKELNLGFGKKIDSFETIYRFNDFSLNKKFFKDYGKKTNVWIRGTNDKLVYTFEEKKKILKKLDLVIIRAKSERNESSRIFFEEEKINYEIFPLKYELQLTEELGFCPSTGLLTLYIFKKIFGFLEPERIFGFSFCQENPDKVLYGGQIHYYNEGNLINPETQKVELIKNTFLISKHNWSIEYLYFKNELMRT